MSANPRQIAPDALQPHSFSFSAENKKRAQEIILKYPAGKQQSAVMPLLTLAQRQHDGWVPRAAMEHVAQMLEMPYIRVMEVATFYTMYNLAPIGKFHIQCCTTTPCWLRGSDDIMRACRDELGIDAGHTTPDGKFTLNEAECLGACVNAPMIEVTTPEWDVYFEDLTYDNTRKLLQQLRRGEMPKEGSQSGRNAAEPATGLTTLAHQQPLWQKMKEA